MVVMISTEFEKRMKPDSYYVELIEGLPGIGKRSDEIVIAEIGADMNQLFIISEISSIY